MSNDQPRDFLAETVDAPEARRLCNWCSHARRLHSGADKDCISVGCSCGGFVGPVGAPAPSPAPGGARRPSVRVARDIVVETLDSAAQLMAEEGIEDLSDAEFREACIERVTKAIEADRAAQPPCPVCADRSAKSDEVDARLDALVASTEALNGKIAAAQPSDTAAGSGNPWALCRHDILLSDCADCGPGGDTSAPTGAAAIAQERLDWWRGRCDIWIKEGKTPPLYDMGSRAEASIILERIQKLPAPAPVPRDDVVAKLRRQVDALVGTCEQHAEVTDGLRKALAERDAMFARWLGSIAKDWRARERAAEQDGDEESALRRNTVAGLIEAMIVDLARGSWLRDFERLDGAGMEAARKCGPCGHVPHNGRCQTWGGALGQCTCAASTTKETTDGK